MALNKDSEEILRVLNDLIVELTGDKSIRLDLRSKLDHSIGITSLGLVQYICMVEDHYSIEIPNVAIHRFKRVNDLVKYILKNKG